MTDISDINYIDLINLQNSKNVSLLDTNYTHKKNLSSLDIINKFRIRNIRISIILLLLLSAFVNANFNIFLQKNFLTCYDDKIQDIFNFLYIFFLNNPNIKTCFIIVMSLIIDILFFTYFIYWLFNNKSTYRFSASLCLFYGLNFLFRHLLLIKKTHYSIFYTKFPSFIVSYSNDDCFIYTLDIGVLNIIANEYYTVYCGLTSVSNHNNDIKNNLSIKLNTKALDKSNQNRCIFSIMYYLCKIIMIIQAILRISTKASFNPSIIISFFFSQFSFNVFYDLDF